LILYYDLAYHDYDHGYDYPLVLILRPEDGAVKDNFIDIMPSQSLLLHFLPYSVLFPQMGAFFTGANPGLFFAYFRRFVSIRLREREE